MIGRLAPEGAAPPMLAHPDDIPTPRLVLRLMEREVVDACLVGNLQRAEQLLGIGIPTELLDEPTALKYAQAQLDADPLYRPWSVRAITLPAARTVVGHIRFHSRPDPDYLHPFARDAVEFGYYDAAEAAGAAMDWAHAAFGIIRLCVSHRTTRSRSR